MTAYTIDTLAAVRKLEQAGFESSQAEAVANLVAHQGEQLATKQDIVGVSQELAAHRWMIGLNVAVTLAVLGLVLALSLRVFGVL